MAPSVGGGRNLLQIISATCVGQKHPKKQDWVKMHLKKTLFSLFVASDGRPRYIQAQNQWAFLGCMSLVGTNEWIQFCVDELDSNTHRPQNSLTTIAWSCISGSTHQSCSSIWLLPSVPNCTCSVILCTHTSRFDAYCLRGSSIQYLTETRYKKWGFQSQRMLCRLQWSRLVNVSSTFPER